MDAGQGNRKNVSYIESIPPSSSASCISHAESSQPQSTEQGGAAIATRHFRQEASNSEQSTGAADTQKLRGSLNAKRKRRHIQYESKRRARINYGFRHLAELIPDLKGCTLSRSAILFATADRLGNLVQENEALVAQVSALESEMGPTWREQAQAHNSGSGDSRT